MFKSKADKEKAKTETDGGKNGKTPDEKTTGKDPAEKSEPTKVVDAEDAYLLDTDPTRDVSNVKTYMNLFKALTGPSTMGMAKVIGNGGLLTGAFGFVTIGFLNAYCNITVVKCAKVLEKKTGKTWYHYEDVIGESVANFSPAPEWQTGAKWAKRLALGMLISCQLGLLSFYYQIIATTLKKEIESSYPEVSVSLFLVEFIVCLCVLPYSWLRNLRLLATFSTVANVFKFICVVVVLEYACTHIQPVRPEDLYPPSPWTVPLFVGGAVFTVEGIAMVLPIENRARKPEDFTGGCGIIAMATSTNVFVNLVMGVFGYMAFGNDVTGNILVSLPHVLLYRVISLMYAGMVFLTFTLQLYQPAEAIYAIVKSKYPTNFVLNYGNVVIRSVITVATFLFAGLVPRADLMMSLVGAVNACILVFILPILAELLLHFNAVDNITEWMWAKNIFLLCFGVMAFVTGTYCSVRDIVLALA